MSKEKKKCPVTSAAAVSRFLVDQNFVGGQQAAFHFHRPPE
jgi:hypothetical protein